MVIQVEKIKKENVIIIHCDKNYFKRCIMRHPEILTMYTPIEIFIC